MEKHVKSRVFFRKPVFVQNVVRLPPIHSNTRLSISQTLDRFLKLMTRVKCGFASPSSGILECNYTDKGQSQFYESKVHCLLLFSLKY